MALAGVIRLVGKRTHEYPMGFVPVIAALAIEIGLPVLATATIEEVWLSYMVTGMIPIPIPAIITAIGLIYIHRLRRNPTVPRVK